jgi:nucleotide-binding universal stress UspA family protein
MFKNVIVGVADLEAGRDALALALQLASGDRPLMLAYVQAVMPKPGPDSGALSLAADRRRALERLAPLQGQSRDSRLVCVEARSVAGGLHELARRHQADLLVIAASRRDDYERLSVGDDTRAVLENAPCPVAVAPIGYATRPPVLDKVGAAYDGSTESRRAVAIAQMLGRERAAHVSAFEAIPVPVDAHDPANPQPEIDRDVDRARKWMAALGDVEPHAAAGDPEEEIKRYAASVDLLVVGSHRYRPVDRLTSGSLAQRLGDRTPCALLVLACDANRRENAQEPVSGRPRWRSSR